MHVYSRLNLHTSITIEALAHGLKCQYTFLDFFALLAVEHEQILYSGG